MKFTIWSQLRYRFLDQKFNSRAEAEEYLRAHNMQNNKHYHIISYVH